MRTVLIVIEAVVLLAVICVAYGASSFYLPNGYQATGTPQEQARQVVEATAESLNSRQPETAFELNEIRYTLEKAIQLDPKNGKAYRVYGRVLMEDVMYMEAEGAFLQALALDSKDQQAQQGLRETRRLLKIEADITQRNRLALCAFKEVPLPNGSGFIAVGGDLVSEGDRIDTLREYYQSPRMQYFIRQGKTYKKTIDIPLRQVETRLDSTYETTKLDFARVWVGDLQKTGHPQILIVSGIIPESFLPSFLQIYEPHGFTLSQVLQIDSTVSPELVDFDKDGRWEVEAIHKIGLTAAVDQMGTWYDIYRYDGKRYVRANARYRTFAKEQLTEMRNLEKQFPDDWDILTHLSQAYRDLGQTKEADSYAQRAKASKLKLMEKIKQRAPAEQ